MKSVSLSVRREAADGAVWEGVAGVSVQDGVWRIVERGTWVRPDGARFEGTINMLVEKTLLKVVTPHDVHAYGLREVEGGFEGDYVCGEDVYRVWGEYPRPEGWRMKMSVEGPRKHDIQVVEYRQLKL